MDSFKDSLANASTTLGKYYTKNENHATVLVNNPSSTGVPSEAISKLKEELNKLKTEASQINVVKSEYSDSLDISKQYFLAQIDKAERNLRELEAAFTPKA